MKQGLCREVDPELFHPELAGLMRTAVKVCGKCDVRSKCLQYALAHMSSDGDDDSSYAIGEYGVWGGTTPPERWSMIGRRPSKAAS
jgi:WhiB family redox-sensing transcriptional regulator